MRFLINLTVLFGLVIPISTCVVENVVEASDAFGQVGVSGEMSFPYVAEIVADNVNIRSGPGTNYYSCLQLDKAARVKVIAHKYSWSHIVPPVGCFSWISKQYVTVDPDNPAIGIVAGDAVRVYAGSKDLKPIHSTTLQLKFNKGDRVKLLGEEQDDYYKIAPPPGAYLWVSAKYTKSLGSTEQYPLAVEPEPQSQAEDIAPGSSEIGTETGGLEAYYALEEQMKAELAKPVDKQDYSAIKQALSEIAENKEAGKAARYAELAMKKVARFDLALVAAKVVELQEAGLKKIEEKIDKARVARLGRVKDLCRFAVIGRLQTSNVYGAETERKRYRIIDDTDKTVCYALPLGQARNLDLDELTGRKVGLIGTIEPHPQTAGALVKFTELTVLK